MSWHEYRKQRKHALETLPEGFAVITSGALRPADMTYSWPEGVWRRHDAPGWLDSPTRAEDVICAARSIRPDLSEYENVRRYVIR